MVIGFGREHIPKARTETPYDSQLGTNVRIDIAGGIGLTGKLIGCEAYDHGYSFSINPAVIYKPNGMPEIYGNKPSRLSSNGNAISIIPIGENLETYVKDIISAKKEKDSNK
jgi:hypothetical protein